MADNRSDGTGVKATSGVKAKTAKKDAKAPGKAKAPKVKKAPAKVTRAGSASAKAADGAAAGKRAAGRSGAARSIGTTGTLAVGGKRTLNLRKELRDFASTRPHGWSHDDWLRFLDELRARGHDVNDRDEIGSQLERERLALALERVRGVGPQRVRAIVDRYGYLWRLKETSVEQLAREANVPRAVAEEVIGALHN